MNKRISLISSFSFGLLLFALSFSTAFAARSITSATLNGSTTVTVSSAANLSLVINVNTTGTGNPAAWESTGWRIATTTGTFTCINTPIHTVKGSYTATSTIIAPAAAGTYNAYFVAYSGTNCANTGNTNPSPTLTLKKAVIVKAAVLPPPPALTITPASLPNGTVSTTYSQTLVASTTATGPFAWSVSSGSLPAGLKLATSTAASDALSGTPTASATSTFTIKATNGTSSSTKSYTIHIAPAVVIPPPTPTSTLAVNITMNGGSSTPANFNLTVTNNTSTAFNGAGAATQSFVMNVGSSYAVTEATTTNSQNYSIALSGNCSGTMTANPANCAITNTFIPVIATSTPTSTPTSTANLIINPSLTADTVTPGIPDSWNEGGWGTNTVAFNYPVAGVNGGTGANVTISAYTSGDAKWYFNNVFVTAGDSYTFTDSYNATVPSALVAQFTASDGTVSYTQLASLPATNGAWATTTQTITAPGSAAAVTVFHLISSVGSLTTTNYSLTAVSNGTGSNLFPEGLVSLTFDDGWQSQYDNALPILQAANMKGTFYIISDGMLNAIETIFPSSDNPFDVATTTKKTTWSEIYPDPTQHSFIFSDTYTASAPSTITVKYTPAGGTATTTTIGTPAAGTNASANFTFTLPELADSSPLTIAQAVTGSNTLTATNPLLQQPVGYMDTNHVLALQAAGEEIGDHTVSHCDLVAIDGNPTNTASCAVNPPDSTTDQQQIDDARTALQNAGLSPVDTFAYPYGSGAGVGDIEADVAADGLISARSVNTGYNTKGTDHYNLLNQAVDATVTDPATIQAWINYAAANHVWLILTFHQVELSTSTINENGETDATTAAILQSTVSYLQQEEAAGKIDVDTVHNIMTQFDQ